MVSHEVWFAECAAPVVLDLEDDQLFQSFKKWVEKDNQFTANGWIGPCEGKTWAINFQQVACITVSSQGQRGTMGFGR